MDSGIIWAATCFSMISYAGLPAPAMEMKLFTFGAALAGKHADERAFAMSGHCDAGEAFVLGKKVYPARHIVYIILEAEFGLFFACCGAAGYAAFVETERGDAFLCQSSARNFSELFFIMGLLPSMSVGAGTGDEQHYGTGCGIGRQEKSPLDVAGSGV